MSNCAQVCVPELDVYLPSFVKDATGLQSLKLVRRANQNIAEFEIRFTGSTGQAKAEFGRIQAIKDKNNTISDQGPVACDGPCGRAEVPAREMFQFGDCDHNICRECMKSSQARTLYDGTPCCCNQRCIAAGSRTVSRNSSLRSRNSIRRGSGESKSKKKEKKKEVKKTEEASSQSMDSQKSQRRSRRENEEFVSLATLQGFNRLVAVKIYAYFVGSRKLMRRTDETELVGHSPMRLLMDKAERLMASPHTAKNKWYYAVKDKFHRSDLIPIEAGSMAKMTVSQLTGIEEVLSLVVVGPGTSI